MKHVRILTDPKGVNVNTSLGIEKGGEFVVPVLLSSAREPIWEGSDT